MDERSVALSIREAADDHFYGAWKGGSARSGGRPMTPAEQAEPNKDEVRDGVRSATAKARVVGPDEALASLAAGRTANVASHQVAHLVSRAAERQDDPNLLNLRVDGREVFGKGHYSRPDLPQVPSAMLPQYLDDLRSRGIKVSEESVVPGSLQPMQREVSTRSTARMLSNPEAVFAKRAIVSSDGYVLDGHHRWSAATIISLTDREKRLGVVRIGLPRERLVRDARSWSAAHGIERKQLGEARADLSEAEDEEHFYGAWKGGSKASGGHPMTKAEQKAAREYPKPHPGPKPDIEGAERALERVRPQGSPAEWVETEKDFAVEVNAMQRQSAFPVKGKANSVQVRRMFVPGEEGFNALFYGDDGRPSGYVMARGGHIIGVAVRPGQKGKGVATRMYDTLQDGGKVDLYDFVGKSRDFTPEGKAFATRWLEHRVEVERQRANRPVPGQLGLGLREERMLPVLAEAAARIARVLPVREGGGSG